MREGTLDRAEREGIAGIRELNKETQKARFAADQIAGKKLKQEANNTLTLTDTIDLAGMTTAAAVNPALLAAYGIKKGASIEAIQAAIIKGLNSKKPQPLPDIKKLEAQRKRTQEKINLSDQKTSAQSGATAEQ